jgi:hypothetical protein
MMSKHLTPTKHPDRFLYGPTILTSADRNRCPAGAPTSGMAIPAADPHPTTRPAIRITGPAPRSPLRNPSDLRHAVAG